MALNLNLLVAEDDLNDQLFWDHLVVKRSWIFVHYVWTGTEAIDYLSGKGPYAKREKYPYPDILFLDMEMPRGNALQVLEWLLANPGTKRPATYIYTGVARSPLRDEVEKHPIDGFFQKPLTPEQVNKILEEKMAS
jgi:CheY-like chemotaxis protein